ncbi:hypothetical protein [Brachybacterium sp. GPGPB12]|uniref:hypothetical protein n=1 Tax=Brachybacterium sp. GPGPB12 TaxID=3023517 RepID=UPI003134366C
MTLSLQADPSQRRDAPVAIEQAVERVEAVTGEQAEVDMDYSCSGPGLTRHQVMNWLGFWLSPRDVDLADPPQGTPFDSEYVVSCADWPEAAELGALRVSDSGYYGYALWVFARGGAGRARGRGTAGPLRSPAGPSAPQGPLPTPSPPIVAGAPE